MEVLAVLREGPKIPTRLCQVCNINYVRLGEYMGPMETKGLVKKEIQEGHEVYVITQEGFKVYEDWMKIWERLKV